MARKKPTSTDNNLPKGPDGKVKAGPGRPKGSKDKWKVRDIDFSAALKYVEKKKGKSFLTHLVELAYSNSAVAIALARKILPDLKSTELDLGVDEDAQDLLSAIASHVGQGKRKLPSQEDD